MRNFLIILFYPVISLLGMNIPPALLLMSGSDIGKDLMRYQMVNSAMRGGMGSNNMLLSLLLTGNL